MAEILRPMSTGELMDRTFVLYRKNFILFVGIASVGPASYLLFQLLTVGSAAVQAGAPNQVSPFSAAGLGFGFLAGGLIMLAGMAIAHGATVRAVAAVHLGMPIRILEAYRSLKGKIWRVIGVFVCMGLLAGLVMIGAGILIAIVILAIRTLFIGSRSPQFEALAIFLVFVPIVLVGISALVVWVRYALAIACCVVEDLGVIKSIKRSAVLSKGSRFRIFLIYFVFVILAALLGAAFSGLAVGVGTLIPVVTLRLIMIYLASFIAGSLTGPLATIGIALVYYDERVRKEAFDLQLMMSSLDPPAASLPTAVPAQP